MTTTSPTAPETAKAPTPKKGRYGGRTMVYLVVAPLVLLSFVIMLTVPMPKQAVGAMAMATVIAMLLLGVPIAFSMLLPGITALLILGGVPALVNTLEENIYSATASWQLSVLPMFILMGIALWRSGLTAGAFEAARQWLGWMPGGLAVSTNLAGAGLAAASGSTIGISYALGRIAIPEMMRARYQPGLAVGSVAMAGTLGQLIPPSIILVIYAGITQVPVGPQLLTAIVPGILVALAYILIIVIRASLRPKLAPRADLSDVTWGTRFRSLLGVLPVAIVVLVVIGGLFSGFFTPTEAGALGALAAILCGWLLGGKENRKLKNLYNFVRISLLETIAATAGIFLLLIAVHAISRVMTLSQVANGLTGVINDLQFTRITFLLALAVLFLILGMFLDPLAVVIMTLPVLMPVLGSLDIDLLWFGVFVVIMAEISMVTPPVGILTFIVHRLAQAPEVNLGVKIDLVDVFKGVLWFVGAAFAVVLLLIFFPEIASWLPELSRAS